MLRTKLSSQLRTVVLSQIVLASEGLSSLARLLNSSSKTPISIEIQLIHRAVPYLSQVFRKYELLTLGELVSFQCDQLHLLRELSCNWCIQRVIRVALLPKLQIHQ